MAMGVLPIKKVTFVDGKPESKEVLETNLNAANKALDNIGRHVDVQAYKEKIEHGMDQSLVDKILKARKKR